MSNDKLSAFRRGLQSHSTVRSGEINRAMVIAMITMRMMQVAVHKVVDVVPMGNRFVSAAWPVYMIGRMAATVMVGRTAIRVFRADLKPVFVNMIAVGMMQMTIMQIVDMVTVPDCSVSAVRPMLMIMMGMMLFGTGAHRVLLD